MGFFDFVKDAGDKLFGGGEPSATEKAEMLKTSINDLGLDVEDFKVVVNDDEAYVYGITPSQAVREKIVLAAGNIEGIARVDDRMKVRAAPTPEPAKPAEPPAQFYTVVSGDSLSKIAKRYYGDAMKYPAIFEANKPMLADPDKIYPGQVLRIPPQDG
jgi:nucleoid-associated protein YgaU